MTDYPGWLLDVVRPGDRLADDEALVSAAIAIAAANVLATGGGPFGAVVADADGLVVAAAANAVLAANDPTAHAEVEAIRRAARARGTWILRGLRLATSCAPCVMCTGAIHWAGLDAVLVAARREDAEAIGFIEGPAEFDGVAFLRGRGIEVEVDIARDDAVAVFRDYQGIIYNGRP